MAITNMAYGYGTHWLLNVQEVVCGYHQHGLWLWNALAIKCTGGSVWLSPTWPMVMERTGY